MNPASPELCTIDLHLDKGDRHGIAAGSFGLLVIVENTQLDTHELLESRHEGR